MSLIINNFNIRPETSLDEREISRVNQLAFGQQDEAILINKIHQSDRYIPELSLVAELQSEIVGYLMFSIIDLVGENTIKVLALAPLAVLPKYQKQGIGSALIQKGLTIIDRYSFPLIVVLGHPAFYSRFGFETSINYEIESPFDVPKEVLMVKILESYQSNYKGKIVYPGAFENL